MIAAQLYTVRDRLQDPKQLAGVFGRLREIGYVGSLESLALGYRNLNELLSALPESG